MKTAAVLAKPREIVVRSRKVWRLSFACLAIFGARLRPESQSIEPHSPRSTALLVSVGDASTGRFIADAQVRLPSVGRVVRTKWNGEALFSELTEGRYRVQVRAVGYAPADLEVQLHGDTVGVFCQLEHITAGLDTVHVTDLYGPKPPKEFQSRRQMGIGRFIDDSVLRLDRAQNLPLLLHTHVPGIMLNARGVYVLEGSGILGSAACGILVYLDGFKLADADLESIRPADLIGVEVYSRASAPVQFRPQGNYCRVLLLWSRW